jgi:hypothetical protein
MDAKSLPTTTAEIRKLTLEWERLDPDALSNCPISLREIRKYVAAEGGGGRAELMFGRTARVENVSFWVWGYVSQSGETFYVDVSSDGRESLVGMGSGEALTVPQYVALRYVRFWRSEPQPRSKR